MNKFADEKRGRERSNTMKFDVFGNRLASGMVYFTVSIHLERSTFSDLREIRRPLICLGTMCGGVVRSAEKDCTKACDWRAALHCWILTGQFASGYSSWLAIRHVFSQVLTSTGAFLIRRK